MIFRCKQFELNIYMIETVFVVFNGIIVHRPIANWLFQNHVSRSILTDRNLLTASPLAVATLFVIVRILYLQSISVSVSSYKVLFRCYSSESIFVKFVCSEIVDFQCRMQFSSFCCYGYWILIQKC